MSQLFRKQVKFSNLHNIEVCIGRNDGSPGWLEVKYFFTGGFGPFFKTPSSVKAAWDRANQYADEYVEALEHCERTNKVMDYPLGHPQAEKEGE